MQAHLRWPGTSKAGSGSPEPRLPQPTGATARVTTRSLLEDTDGDGVATKSRSSRTSSASRRAWLPYAGGLIVHQAPVTLFLKDTNGDGKADMRQGPVHADGAPATRTPGRATSATASTTGSTGRVGYSGFNGTVGGERVTLPPGLLSLQAATGRSSNSCAARPTTRGASASTRWPIFGSTANGCPIVLHANPEPLLREGERLAPRCCKTSPTATNFTNHRQGAAGRFPRRVHGGGHRASTPPAPTRGNTGTAPAFVCEPTGHLTATFTLEHGHRSSTPTTAGTWWRATTNGPPRSSARSAPTATCGSSTGTPTSCSTTQRRRASQRQGQRLRNRPARQEARPRVLASVYTKAKPEKTPNLKDATPGNWSRL